MIQRIYLFILIFTLNSCVTTSNVNFPTSLNYRSDELNEQLKEVCAFDNCNHIFDYFKQTDDFILKYQLFIKQYENKLFILEQ